MKKLGFTLASCVFAATMGCQQSSSPTQLDQGASSSASPDNHGHDHSAGNAKDHSVAGHAHGIGPHEGTIADWGGGTYHVEFTVDHEQQLATVYVLGSDEKTASPIEAESIELSLSDPELQVVLNADPQEGDPEGKSSRYVGTHEQLGVVQEYAGTLTGVVDGTPYSGDFKEEPHGDHEH